MQTLLTDSPEVAAQFIRAGEVVAFPTETVYGLGANIFDAEAIQKIFQAKGRPTDNPLIAHISSVAQLELLAAQISPLAATLVEHFFPGPLTLVLPKRPTIPAQATAGLDTIGIRMPDHELAQALLQACQIPLVAPSANLSGKPSPTTWQAVETDLAGRIACILRGELTRFGVESTVVDCTSETPLLLRAGAITLEQLRAVLPNTEIADAKSLVTRRSPGTKYKHYAPQARVVLSSPSDAIPEPAVSAFIGLHPPPQVEAFRQVQLCRDVEEYMQQLFQFFRACDAAGIVVIYCEPVSTEGLGLALMDRLRRAAEL